MATANYSPTVRSWLEFDTFATTNHAANTGQWGDYARGTSVGWTDETLLVFAGVSALAGGTVTSVALDVVCNTKYGTPGSQTGYLYDQDKTAPASQSSPPIFSDFGSPGTAWATQVQTVAGVQNTGTYTFSTNATFVSLVQSWIDNSSNNWGVICSVNFGFVGWALSIDSATLKVTYTPAAVGTVVPQIVHNYRQRRL